MTPRESTNFRSRKNSQNEFYLSVIIDSSAFDRFQRNCSRQKVAPSVSGREKSTAMPIFSGQEVYFLRDAMLWKSCESSVGGPHGLCKFSLAAQRAFSENPPSS